jgi:hypothetical protein
MSQARSDIDEKVNAPAAELTAAQKKEKERREAREKKEKERREKAEAAEKKRRENFETKLKQAANKRRARAEKALANRTAKRQRNKNKLAESRATLRATLHARVLAKAREEAVSLANEDIKIPEKGAAESKFQTYVNAAKKRFYKRTKRMTPAQQAMMQRLANNGINAKYVKFGSRYKTYENVLKAAQKRANKNGSKTQKSQKREQILAYAQASLGMDEKAVRSAICIKQKK